MNLEDISRELKAVIVESIDARRLNVYDLVPDHALVVPALVITPASAFVAYHDAFAGGAADVQLTLELFAPGNEAGQRTLLKLLSAGAGEGASVIDAIESGRLSRPAVWSDVLVQQATWRGRQVLADEGQTPMYRASLTVHVYLPRS